MHIYVHSHSRISALVTLLLPQDLYNGHRSRREDYSRAVTMVQATPWDWELLQKIYHFQILPLGFVFGLKNWILNASLPPEVLKLTPHVDSCLLLQLLVQLVQHCGHRLLVELTGAINRRILSRVILYIVQPVIIWIFSISMKIQIR